MGFLAALIILILAAFISGEIQSEFFHRVFLATMVFWCIWLWPRRQQDSSTSTIKQNTSSEAVTMPSEPETLYGTCSVNDGDGITVSGERIRLAGVDAPETNQIAIDANVHAVAHGALVKRALKNKIDEKPVTVTVLGRDKFGRLIGIVWSDDDHKRSINEWLVLRGFAIAAYKQDYRRAEQWARERRLGMWAYRTVFDPRDWRHKIEPLNLVHQSRDKLHKAGNN